MPNKKEKTFEQAMNRLEELLQNLEGGNESLDQMLKLYGEGVELIRFCNQKLESAEQSVKQLAITPDGVALRNFGTEED